MTKNYKIHFDGQEYDLKYSLRGLFFYESITGHSFGQFSGTISDTYVLFYAFVLSSNPETTQTLDFNHFIDVNDENPKLISVFNEFFQKANERQSLLSAEDDEENSKKSKSKKKV